MIIKTNVDEIQNYLHDTSGLFSQNIDAVYFPESTEDVQTIIKQANLTKRKVTVSGNGTGTTGGRTTTQGIILATDRLNKISNLTIDPNNSEFLTVQAGLTLKEIQLHLDQFGLFYPPDPTEQNAFIGGTIATNASGARTFKYGATRHWIESITIILPQGDKLILNRGDYLSSNNQFHFSSDERSYTLSLPTYRMPDIKHAAGYFVKPNMDLIDLFIGSEGTLGVITEIKLKLLKKPEKNFSGVLFFHQENELLDFVDEVIRLTNFNKNNPNQLAATSIEYFDEQSLQFLSKKYSQTPINTTGAILFEQECTASNEEDLLNQWYNLAVTFHVDIDSSWFAQNQKDRDFFKEYRHALPAQINEFLSFHKVKKISSDIAVPKEHFRELMSVYHQLLDNSSFKFVIFGHIGNYHVHTNILPYNEDDFQKGKEVYKIFISTAIGMGGTISAEHGIGKIKVPYLLDMLGEAGVRQMADVKKVLDPNLVLGIGTLIPEDFLY